MKKLPLSCVPLGAVGFVDCVADISSKKRLVEMGFTKKARVIPLHISPGGNPVAYFVKGVVLAVRHEDAENIFVTIGEE